MKRKIVLQFTLIKESVPLLTMTKYKKLFEKNFICEEKLFYFLSNKLYKKKQKIKEKKNLKFY